MPDFTGEFGGLMAGAAITGFGLGWTLCKKILADPFSIRLARAETKIETVNERMADHFWGEFQKRLGSTSSGE